MKIAFPSREFDEAVAAVCHGSASDGQMRALNELLRTDGAARDEYILRVEVHSRLASNPDLFSAADDGKLLSLEGVFTPQPQRRRHNKLSAPPGTGLLRWIVALAACVALLASGWWLVVPSRSREREGTTSMAVAMLNQVVEAKWNTAGEAPRLGAPLEPGRLRLESGFAQIVFYSGARVAIEGPAELQLISSGHASCRQGRLTAEVPSQARGFRVDTPQGTVTDLGTSFGLNVEDRRTELHVFKGSVDLQAASNPTNQNFLAGSGAVLEDSRAPRLIPADRAEFATLFDLQAKSLAAEALRFDEWRAASDRLNSDPSLLVHFDFANGQPSRWQLRNVSKRGIEMSEATVVGCHWAEGRWPEKRALDFQNESDRVRLNVPGEFDALTLAAWVRVQGLDRELNSLFMCDGFGAGSMHWLVRNDGVLSLTIVGREAGNYQIVTSPPVLRLDKFGMWLHLAVVLDGRTGRVMHYLNGQPVSETELKIKPPYRIGAAELGNWNAKGFPKNDPFMIRNFSGAMDEFCLFSRALNPREIHALYAEGRPDAETMTSPVARVNLPEQLPLPTHNKPQ